MVQQSKPTKKYRRIFVTLALIAAIGVYIAYAGYRFPLPSRQGVGLNWPENSRPEKFTSLKVAVFNIHSGKGIDGVRDLNRTANVLKGIHLAGLNEVRGSAHWFAKDQAAQLGEKLGCGYLFAPNQTRWHMPHFGNGLLSRLEIAPWTSEPLVYDPKQSLSHRNLITTEIEIQNQKVKLFVTHIDLGTDAIRRRQLKSVLDRFERYPTAILIGDLNTTQDDPVLIDFFSDTANTDAIKAVLGENHSPTKIDWIITRGLRPIAGGMIADGASDHPCLWVEITLPND